MAQNELANWITAASTALTAILTGTGGLAAWLVLRRDKLRELPVMERSIHAVDDHLLLALTVRNRLDETIKLDRIELRQPKDATISPPYSSIAGAAPYGGPGPAVRGNERFLLPRYSVAAHGTRPSQHSTGDVAYWKFAIWPSPSWEGGKIVIVLRISSMAETIRNRRIVIKNNVPAATVRQIAEKAKSAA